jgi:glutamate decarboxylase
MLADLYHAPDPTNVKGTATIGSTEACLLGELCLKHWWHLVQEYQQRESLFCGHTPAVDLPDAVCDIACQLAGGLNMKKRWMDAQRAKGKPTDRPNLIISDALQVSGPPGG